MMNSLAPEKCDINHKSGISEHMLKIDIMKTSCEISPRFIPQDTYNHESTLVQAISWCRQAKSHYRSQCWPGFIYEITELEGVDIWHYNDVISGCDSVSNHQPHDCLLSRLFRHRSKKTSKLCVTGLCAGNSPVTGEFPAQRASKAENVSIWWRYLGAIVDLLSN